MQLVQVAPSLETQAISIIRAYLQSNAVDGSSAEELQRKINPFLPKGPPFFNIQTLHTRMHDLYSAELRDSLTKVNLALFLHRVFQNDLAVLNIIQDRFRECIYGSSATFSQTYGSMLLMLKTHCYIRNMQVGDHENLNNVFPGEARYIGHLLGSMSGGRRPREVATLTQQFENRRQELLQSNLQELEQRFPRSELPAAARQFVHHVLQSATPSALFQTAGNRQRYTRGNDILDSLQEADQGIGYIGAPFPPLGSAAPPQPSKGKSKLISVSQIEDTDGGAVAPPNIDPMLQQEDGRAAATVSSNISAPPPPPPVAGTSRITETVIPTGDQTYPGIELGARSGTGKKGGSGGLGGISGDDEASTSRAKQIHRAWNEEETSTLIEMVTQFGPRWAQILDYDRTMGNNVFEGRNQVSLKDKARNLKVQQYSYLFGAEI